MRVLRVGVGVLTLLVAVPVLIAGALAWWAMQHRGPDGAFHAELAPIESAGGIIVVPDVDAVLRRDAPIARAQQTSLRLKAEGFIGMASAADVATYLAGADYTELRGVTLTRGPVPSHVRHVTGTGEKPTDPRDQDFWVRRGVGELVWRPADDRDAQVALVIVAPGAIGPVAAPGWAARQPVPVEAAVTANWLNSTTWGLLILGPVLLMLGLATLAWPQRPREIVYVMDSAAAAQAGLPSPSHVSTPVVNVAYQPVGRYAPPPQAPAPPAELSWPPPEPAGQTEPVREVEEPQEETMPQLAVDADNRPMPIAGVHLHLSQRAGAHPPR